MLYIRLNTDMLIRKEVENIMQFSNRSKTCRQFVEPLRGGSPKKITKVWTYVQTGLTLPTWHPSMDKNKFGQVLLLSTLPTYPKSLNV